MKKTVILAAVALSLPAACTERASAPIGKPNPATEYCISQGGAHEVRRTSAGDVGDCRLPDGRVVDEWEFYRSRNQMP